MASSLFFSLPIRLGLAALALTALVSAATHPVE
jgi:hypothetical protein